VVGSKIKGGIKIEAESSLTLFPELFAQSALSEAGAVRRDNLLDQNARKGLLAALSKSKLNAQQREAVQHVYGPLLVLAGAGSGKTRVVSHRAAHLVGLGHRPRKILLVTFTNKARDEMEQRCADLLRDFTWGRPTVLTLHSLGSRILRKNPELADYNPEVRLVSDIYQDKFLKRGLSKLDRDQISRLGRSPVESLKTLIGLWKNRLVTPDQLSEQEVWLRPAYEEYQNWLKRANLVDCDDLVRLPICIFSQPERGAEVLDSWRKKFDFIMVDEYQDTSQAQFELVRLLSAEHRNICVVGDDDQSIYGWRAADVDLIRRFPEQWPGAKFVKLEINYRSTQAILDLGNSVMRHERGRHEKVLVAAHAGGVQPVVRQHETDLDEALWIADLLRDSKQRLDSFAILVRSQFRLEPIKEALQEAGIPYQEWRRDRFKLGDVKRNVYSMLAAIHDPHKEEPAFVQLLEDSIFAPEHRDYESFMLRRDHANTNIWGLLTQGDFEAFESETRSKFQSLRSTLEALHDEASRKPRRLKLSELAFSGMQAIYPLATTEKEWGSEQPISDVTTSLRRIHRFIDAYEDRTKRPSLKGFLGHLERIRRKSHEPQALLDQAGTTNRGAVIISTIHGAKGLEFPNVIMPGLVEGFLPSRQAIQLDEEGPLAEERRLFYVALTRAMRGLWLSFSDYKTYRSALRASMPSRYIYESGAHRLISYGQSTDPRPIQGELGL